MTIDEIYKIRDKHSDGWKKEDKRKWSPWFTSPDSMIMKTVARRLCKSLPVSPEMQKAISFDEENDIPSKKSTPEKLEDAILKEVEGNIEGEAGKDGDLAPDMGGKASMPA